MRQNIPPQEGRFLSLAIFLDLSRMDWFDAKNLIVAAMGQARQKSPRQTAV